MADYFVRIDDANAMRRELLESSKMCIQTLKKEHTLNHLREQKAQISSVIRSNLKELNFLLSTLEKDLPALTKKELEELNPTAVQKINAKRAQAKHKGKSAAHTEEHKPAKLSKIERLEHSLSEVEKRLSKL